MTSESFRLRLESLLNENSMEDSSNTPDFILATFLSRCLEAFDLSTRERDKWYGVKLEPGLPCGAEKGKDAS